MTEQIDQLRDLLGLHDRSIASFVSLAGTRTIPGVDLPGKFREYELTGDHTLTFELTIPAA